MVSRYVRRPIANASNAGATPNEIYMYLSIVRVRRWASVTYKVSKAVQLLPQHTTLLSPTCDLAIHKVEHEASDWEYQGGP